MSELHRFLKSIVMQDAEADDTHCEGRPGVHDDAQPADISPAAAAAP